MTHPSRRLLHVGLLGVTTTLLAPPIAQGAGAWPSGVKGLRPRSGKVIKLSGALARGKKIDLAWAANSSVACFPATRFDRYSGAHVFYGFALPAKSVVKIRAVPARPDVDVSLYAYSVGASDTSRIAPNVSSVVSCEASYGLQGANPGKTEAVELNATTNPYNVVVGVAGAKGLTKGDFRLEVELITAAPEAGSTTPPRVKDVKTVRGKTVTVRGRLEEGHAIVLGWADDSSMACWPANKNDYFTGAHAMFRGDLPKYTTMKVKVTPDSPKLDLSLYGYTISSGARDRVAPGVTSCVSCEASYPSSGTNPGQPESIELVAINNPYTAVLGVAGAKGATKGSFKLEIELVPR